MHRWNDSKGSSLAPSYFEHGARRLSALCRANGLSDRVEEAKEAFHWLVSPWGRRRVGTLDEGWISDVADDHTPYELSVVYGGSAPEVRMLVEAQGEPAGLMESWQAGLELSARIGARFGVPLERHDRVARLFTPAAGARLGIWHAVSLRPGGEPELKVYFDSQAQGPGRAAALMEEALDALGFSRAWPAVRSMGRRGLALDVLRFLALDLTRSGDARVKVYWQHHDASAAQLADVVQAVGCGGAEIERFCRAMAGSAGPYRERPVFTCTTLVDPTSARPFGCSLYFPIVAYAPSDAAACERIAAYLAESGLGSDRYRATVAALTSRSLDETASLHSYVALRRRHADPQVTVYFSPEAHGIAQARVAAAPAPAPKPVLGAEEIVRRYEHDILLEDHPFLRRLGREPVALGHLWLVMANFWEAIVSDFPTRLSHVIARMEDDAIRSIFVKQLNDELGEGDFSRAHKAMFRRLLAAVEPHRLPGDDDRLLAPGRAFGRALKAHLYGDDWYESIGALMLIEIYGKQVDLRLGKEFRRQHELDDDSLAWLRLHETLEVDHADDSARLAAILPRPGDGPEAESRLAALWRGADGVVNAGWLYFDALYALCYP